MYDAYPARRASARVLFIELAALGVRSTGRSPDRRKDKGLSVTDRRIKPQRLERTMFETPRAAEYFTAEGLTKLTEQNEESFGDVVVKELGDNALDASETAKVVPELLMSCERRGELTDVSISDNGEGISPKTVESMQNFATLTSDKAHYRTPTRGSQGNALKTIIGIPHALGLGGEPVVIEGRGLRHTIKPVIDAAGLPRLPRKVEAIDRAMGTKVTVPLPHARTNLDLSYWARAFALFNAQAFVKIEQFDGAIEQGKRIPKAVESYKPTTLEPESFSKYLPNDWGSPHWYSPGALGALIGAHVAKILDGDEDLPLGPFIMGFTGLTSSAKANRIRKHLQDIKYLSDFGRDDHQLDESRVRLLLNAMQAESKAPTHKTLGRLGRDHFEARFEEMYGALWNFNYKHVESRWPKSGLPYIFEFAVAETKDLHPNALFYGVNHSPTFSDPLRGASLVGPKYNAFGTNEFLRDGYAHPKWMTSDDPGPRRAFTAVALHFITPAPMFTGKGKTGLDLGGM